MSFPWAVPIAAVLLTAGFFLAMDCTDDSEGVNEGFASVRNGDAVTVTGHGTLGWVSDWIGVKALTVIPEGGEVQIDIKGFYDRDELETVTVQGSVGSVGNRAFQNCNALTAVTIYGSVESVGNHAFEGCDTLSVITVQGSVGSIGDNAFCECDALQTVTVQGSVGSIGDNAFEGCDTLSVITVQGSVGSIGGNAFHYCNELNTVTITGPISSIGYDAFLGCYKLETLNIACNDHLGIEKGHNENGSIAKYATTLNHVHRYSATYEWADDGSACTVHISCENDSVLIYDDHPEVIHTVKVQPTETAMGTTEYSVYGTYDGFDYSDTKDVQDIPSTGGSDSGNDVDALVYIAAAGAIGAAVLIGAAFVIMKTRRGH